MNKESGFTLIEVMIALLILAIALTALMMGIRSNIQNTSKIENQSIAAWVAINTAHEMQSGLKPLITNTETITVFGEAWSVSSVVSLMPDSNIQNININVGTLTQPQLTHVQAYAKQ